MIVAGIGLGALLPAVVAPLVLDNYFELHWALFLCGLLFLLVCLLARAAESPSANRVVALFDNWQAISCSLLIAAIFGLDWFVRHFGPEIKGLSKSAMIAIRI